MLHLVYLMISTAILAKTSDIVVENASKLSRFFGIGQLAAGMILLAVITSLPELSVAVVSGSVGEGAISAGSVFGSNIANILLVLGIGAFLYSVNIPWRKVGEIGMILLLTTLISIYIIFSSQVYGTALDFPVGVVLLLMFGAYVYYLLKQRPSEEQKNNVKVDKKKAMKAFIFFVAGMIVVFISSGMVVENAVATAKQFKVAQSLIGATVIAVGTSLPELSTTLQSVRKRRYGMAVGNIVGSNMTNLTLVLGTTAVLDQIEVRLPIFIAALLFAIAANAVLLYFAAIRKNLGRYTGIFLLTIYAIFLVTIAGLQSVELQA